MSSLQDVYWVASPLGIKKRSEIRQKVGKYLPSKGSWPTHEWKVFYKIRHWTLQVGDTCYELSPDAKKKLVGSNKIKDMCAPDSSLASKWYQIRDGWGTKPEWIKVGQTRMTHNQIVAESNFIWSSFNGDEYGLFTQNCQNFVVILHSRIAVPKDDPKIPDDEKSLWESMPKPTSRIMADISQRTLAGGATIGAGGYLATLAEGSMAAAATAESLQGAAALTTVQSAGAVGTTAATAGSAQGVAGAAAGSTSSAQGVAGASAGTTKAGFGGKLASLGHGLGHGVGHGLMHSAVGSKVVIVGSTAAKAGVVAACSGPAAPVAGAVIIVGATCFALKGKGDIKWIKRNRSASSTDSDDTNEEDLSFEDALELEGELLDQMENGNHGPDAKILDPAENPEAVQAIIDGESPEEVHALVDGGVLEPVQSPEEVPAIIDGGILEPVQSPEQVDGALADGLKTMRVSQAAVS